MTKLAKGQIAQLQTQLQRGEALSMEQQRQIVAYVIDEDRQASANLDALVMARETYDKLCKIETDETHLTTPFLKLLVELGVNLGRDPS